MRFNVTNRTGKVRSFPGGGRYLTLAGGEVERNVELSKEEESALKATGEFHVLEVKDTGSKPEAKSPPAPASEGKPAAKATIV